MAFRQLLRDTFPRLHELDVKMKLQDERIVLEERHIRRERRMASIMETFVKLFAHRIKEISQEMLNVS